MSRTYLVNLFDFRKEMTFEIVFTIQVSYSIQDNRKQDRGRALAARTRWTALATHECYTIADS